MSEANANVVGGYNNKVLIIAVTVVVLTIVLMYLRDRQQQRALELRRRERRVELLEEWGLPRQNRLPNDEGSYGKIF